MTQTNAHMKRLVVLLIACIFAGTTAWAKKASAKKAVAKTAQKSQKDGEKLDSSDLEKKYWAPNDTDFSVVQNRTYSKDKRFAISVNWGKIINDTYTEGDVVGVNANYYFSERQGIELNYLGELNFKSSEVINAFQGSFTTTASPNHNRLVNYVGASYNWVPVYAKMSLLGKKIVYFDMAFKVGVGMTTYEKQTENNLFNEEDSAFTYSFGVTQTIFLSKHWSIKADYIGYFYKEDLLRFGGQSSRQEAGSRNNNSTYLTLGLQYFF